MCTAANQGQFHVRLHINHHQTTTTILLHASSSTNRIPISAFIPTFLNGNLTKTRTITIHHDARPSHRNVLLSTDDATKQLIAMFGQMVEEIRPL